MLARARACSTVAWALRKLLFCRRPSACLVELETRFEHLALQALVKLRRLGLAPERAQAAARLTLDVERAVEVLLRALELRLRAAAALAVLA